MNIIEVNINDTAYPEFLRNIKAPPKKLYCVGNVDLLKTRCVCVVGSRKTTEYGKWAAEKVAEKLVAHGVTVVSGLALGIDTAAHGGAMKGSGSTIAVLGCGINIQYPWANRELRKAINEKGLVVSEYEPNRTPEKFTFPQRNRIIAGLSECAVVVEAGLNSGALITAELVSSQGKDVYVVPSNINSASGMGGNMLLRDGAIPLVVIDDLIEYLHLEKKDDIDILKYLGNDEKKIFSILAKGGEQSIDELSLITKISSGKVNGIVTVLEMKGLVYTALGKVFIAKM